MSRCDQESLSAYRDGALQGAGLATMEQHLPGCAACRAALQELAEVDRLLARRGHLPGARTSPARRSRMRGWLGGAAAVAAALILATTLTHPRVVPHRADVLAVPVANLQILNEQSLGDQEALLETYEWELRALQLQLECMGENPGSQDLRHRTDALLARVTEVRNGVQKESGTWNRGGSR